jgi:hypothetical protein
VNALAEMGDSVLDFYFTSPDDDFEENIKIEYIEMFFRLGFKV